jgi:hypothetical protein
MIGKPSHPYEALSVRSLRAATVGTAFAWGLLTLILVWAVPAAQLAELRTLLETTEPAAARAILESWGPSLVLSFAFLLGFDFLYDVVHNNAVALLAVWGAVRCDTRLARSVGAMTAWVLWLDTALNVFENLAFLHVLRSRSPEPLLPAVSAVFSFRSATLMAGLLVGAVLHACAWRAGWATGRRSGPA